MEVLGL